MPPGWCTDDETFPMENGAARPYRRCCLCLLTYVLVDDRRLFVSVSYVFVLPVILGLIPVLFSTTEQLRSYKDYLLLPWGITLTSPLIISDWTLSMWGWLFVQPARAL